MLHRVRHCIALVLALLYLLNGGWTQAQGLVATLPDNLADFRALAVDLRKTGPGKNTAVVLEYRVSRSSNACAGDEPESILRLHGDGRLSLLVTRSFRETEVHGPGRFSGRVPRARWDSAFARFAAMKWVEQSFLPMPGMSESHLMLRLQCARHSLLRRLPILISASVKLFFSGIFSRPKMPGKNFMEKVTASHTDLKGPIHLRSWVRRWTSTWSFGRPASRSVLPFRPKASRIPHPMGVEIFPTRHHLCRKKML